jgi:hypothetical protein
LFSLHKIPVSLFAFFLPLYVYSGNPYRFSGGAPEAGMGSVCIIKQGFWSSFGNQALLADNHSVIIGFSYENRFFINELGTRTIGGIFPAGNASVGVHYSSFGYSEFRRETAGIASGLALSENINAGIQIDYFSERTSGEYDNNQYVTFEAGMTWKSSSGVITAVHLFNPVPNSLRKSSLPASLRVGAGIELSNVLFAGAEAEMSTGRKIILRTGFEYEAAKKFWLRGGFSTENTSFSFGMGYLIKSIKIDLSFSTHEKLGITSGASIIFKIH